MYQSQYGYGGYTQQQMWQRPPVQTAPTYAGEIVKVNGMAGAQALRLMPNSSLIALDTTAPIVWLCQADGAGYFTPEAYSISPYQAQTPESNFEKRLSRLEAIILEQPDSEQAQPRRRRPVEQPSE